MLKKFFNELEKRNPLDSVIERYPALFQRDPVNHIKLSESGFSSLMQYLEKGGLSFQNIAVQVGAKWSTSTQKIALRNAIQRRGFLTPSCLWAFRQVRGGTEPLFKEYPSPEMALMQIILLKEADPAQCIPFLIERFLSRKDIPEELRTAARLCILRILDLGVNPDLMRCLQTRYPGNQILDQWRPTIPGNPIKFETKPVRGSIDFHQLVRSIHDMKELSSLTRTAYITSMFYVPLTEKEWRSLWLTRTDQMFFHKLFLAGIVEVSDGGFSLSTDPARQTILKNFLYESYPWVKESVQRVSNERQKEKRQQRVRNSELDRQALEMIADGIICIDRTGSFYYMNTAAETILYQNRVLREYLFGQGSLDDVMKKYSRDAVISRISLLTKQDNTSAEIFGDRILIWAAGKRYEIELSQQIILLRDVTDKYLIDLEIGKLYRHELKASLDVMGIGIDTCKQFFLQGKLEEGSECLSQLEKKRMEILSMLEEKMDFIRLHSDSFQIRPSKVNVNLVVDKCLSNYKDAATAKGITLKSNHLHTDALFVLGEERFLIRALDNIIRNAIKFSNHGSEVKTSLSLSSYEVCVKVEDSGPGIPSQDLGKVFQLGFTTNGTGRGLYLAKRIIFAHHGRIEVKSKPGSGACFTLKLPALMES